MTSPRTSADDAALLEAAVALLSDARRRARGDFLAMLAVLLLAVAGAVLVLGLVSGGWMRDVGINLAVEIGGALLTVVLIDGLWRRVERGLLSDFDALTEALAARAGVGLSEAERSACRILVDGQARTHHSSSLVGQLRAALFYARHRRELRALEQILLEGKAASIAARSRA